jgi:lipopolysaccharide transport system permease protein
MSLKTTTYSAEPDSLSHSLAKLRRYSSLIRTFAWRDIRVNYAQTRLGLSWSILKPLIGLLIYTFFFGYLLQWNSGSLPYPLYVLSGLIGWNLFSFIIQNGALAVRESTNLIKKIYFPKSILILSKTLVGLTEALISFLLLIPFLIYYEITPSWKIVFLPLVLFYNLSCALAFTFLITSFSIQKRDLLQVLPFLLHMGIWLTPVFWAADLLPEKMNLLLELNPIANMIQLWRWMLFDHIDFQEIWLLNGIFVSVILIMAFYFYSVRENKFADYL